MQKIKDFILNQTGATFSSTEFVTNIILCILFSLIISIFYQKFGFALSNRKKIGNNLILLALTTMVVITVVKSSLALSLGLVGALSIVRFRTPIKDPEELVIIFVNLAIGLCLGADQRLISFIATIAFIAVIFAKKKLSNKTDLNEFDTLLSISYQGKDVSNYQKIIDQVVAKSSTISLSRLDIHEDKFEVLFTLRAEDIRQINLLINTINNIETSAKISFLTPNS